jgi:hypothetical protein
MGGCSYLLAIRFTVFAPFTFANRREFLSSKTGNGPAWQNVPKIAMYINAYVSNDNRRKMLSTFTKEFSKDLAVESTCNDI